MSSRSYLGQGAPSFPSIRFAMTQDFDVIQRYFVDFSFPQTDTIIEHIEVVFNYSKCDCFIQFHPQSAVIYRWYELEGNSPWNLTEQIARMLFCDKRWNSLQYGRYYPSPCHQHCSIGVLLRQAVWHKLNEVKSHLGLLLWCAIPPSANYRLRLMKQRQLRLRCARLLQWDALKVVL